MNFKRFAVILFAAGFIAAGGILAYQNRPRPPVESKFVQNVREATSEPDSLETAENSHIRSESTVEVKTPPESINLGSFNHSYQTFNNCGPTTLSMALGWYGENVSQKELGDKMRPYQVANGDNDDKAVFMNEFVMWANEYGYEAITRPNGDIETLKRFTANGFPVVVKTMLEPTDDVGHFRIIKGYDEARDVIIQDDSYQGPNREFAYYDFLELWQPFHYVYLVVYKPEEAALVEAIIADEMDEQVAWKNTLLRAEREAELTDSSFPEYNMAVANYYLGNYEESVAKYESVAGSLPKRMLWYQLEPIWAMQKLKQHDKILALSQRILDGGNKAFSELYLIRGEVYLAQGNKDAARAEFEKAVQYNVNYQPARDALQNL